MDRKVQESMNDLRNHIETYEKMGGEAEWAYTDLEDIEKYIVKLEELIEAMDKQNEELQNEIDKLRYE